MAKLVHLQHGSFKSVSFTNVSFKLIKRSILVYLLAFSNPGFSEDMSEFFEMTLDELGQIQVTSSSLTPVQINASPSTIYLYQQPTMNALGWLQLQDLLKFAPGIEFSNPYSWLQGGQRGSRGNWSNSKILINGEPINLLFTGEAWIGHQLILPSFKRVEVIQGPSSIIYGSDAFNGVINLVTDDESTMEHLSLALGNNESQQWTLQVGRGLTQGDWKAHFSGAMVQKRDQDFSDFVVTDEFSSVNQTERRALISSGAQQYRDNNVAAQVMASLNYSSLGNSSGYGYSNQNFTSQDGNLTWHNQFVYFYDRDGGGLESPEISFQNFESIREQLLLTSRLTKTLGLDQYGIKAKHRTDKELNLFNLREPINGGLSELYHYDIDPSRQNTLELIADWQFPDFNNTTTLLLGYEESEIKKPFFELDDNSDLIPYLDREETYMTLETRQMLGDVTLHLGSRLADHNLYEVPVVNRGTISYQFNEDWEGKLIYGTGFRAPTLFELEINNQLTPSEIENYEVQLNYRFSEQLYTELVFYKNSIKDANSILFDSTGDGVDDFVATKIDMLDSNGIELSARFQINRAEGEVWASYTDTKKFDNIQNLKSGGHVIYHFSDYWSGSLQAKWVEGFDTIVLDSTQMNSSRSIAAYFTLDASVNLSFNQQQFQLRLTNLTDSNNEFANFRGNDPKFFPEEGQTIQLGYTYRL